MPQVAYPSSWVEWFGPSAWKFLHSVSFTFPDKPDEEEQKEYKDFFTSVGDVLPCPGCAMHYKGYLATHPVDTESRESLAKWVYDLHDDVNRRTGKKSPSFEKVKEIYSNWSPEMQSDARKMGTAARHAMLADPYITNRSATSEEQSLVLACAASLLLGLGLGAFAFRAIQKRRNKDC